MYCSCPSLLVHCRNGIPHWLLAILEKYPTTAQLSRAHATTMVKIPYVTIKLAQAIITAAQNDVASTADAVSACSIQVAAQQILALEKSIATMKTALSKKWGKHPLVQLLCSFKGIGIFSALGLLINIRSIDLFDDAKNLVSYFGLHPIWRESGDGTFGYHMSKQGRVQPREILFMVAWSAVRYNPHIKELYRKCMAEKEMKPLEALGVVMHKILRIIYGMLKTNTAYNAEIDKKNQTKTVIVVKKDHQQAHEKKIRRFQCKDDAAPISRRQARKREKANGSQCTISAECGITASLSS
jgi:hypothetical protein